MLKRILGAFLIVVMALTIVPTLDRSKVTAVAEIEDFTYDGEIGLPSVAYEECNLGAGIGAPEFVCC